MSTIDTYLNEHENKNLLRFITCGSVDDGKSTLIGRLLFDSKLIYEDQPYLFLYSADSLPIVNSRFKNVESSPIGIGYNFIKWYVPREEQKLVMNP